MSFGKQISLVLLSLAGLALLSTGGQWSTENNPNGTDVIENEIENREAMSQSADDKMVEVTQTQEAVVFNAESNQEVKLIDLEDYSQAPADNGSPYYVKVNRLQNVVTVYTLDEDGYYTKPVRAMICSVGMNDGTPTGTYTTEDKYPWRSLVGGVYGQYAYRIQGPIMFHSVPYYTMNKGNLETAEYNKLGEAASLGCVRLAVIDAKWIYENCPAGTLVTIYDSEYPGPLGKPTAEQLDTRDDRSRWDPTDPDEENPWNEEGVRILGVGSRVFERGYTYSLTDGIFALDQYGNDITSQILIEGNVDIMKAGEYSVTYRVSDEEGEESSVTCTVQVVDTILPELHVEENRITLNHAQASEANCVDYIRQRIRVEDTGMQLGKECIQVDASALNGQVSGSFQVKVWAEDAAGNRTESQTITVYLDREAPMISEPEQKEFVGTSELDIRRQLLKAIPVVDNYSGVEQVHISWVNRANGTSTVLVTARDRYGNVNSKFFDDFIISYGSGE